MDMGAPSSSTEACSGGKITVVRRHAPRAVLAVALLAHLGLGVALATGGLRPFFNDIRNRPGPGADFFAVYHAGRQVVTGRVPYDHEERPRVTPPHFAPFRYPPGVAWTLGAGVAWIRPWIAYGLWIAALEALLLFGVWRLGELVSDPARLAWLRAAWLVFPPFFLELWMGQFTFVAAMLTFFAVLAWRRAPARPGRAAAAWAAACVLKVFPLALAPALAARRRWGALAACAVAVGAALAPLGAIDGGVRGFFALNFGAPEPAEVHAGNFSLLVLLHRVVTLLDAPPEPAMWAQVARVLSWGLAAVVAVAMWRARRGDLALSAAAALWLLPLMSKDSWEHHTVVALPALALMAHAFAASPRVLRATAAVWAVIAAPSLLVVLQRGPDAWYPDASWSPAAQVAYHAPRPLAALVGLSLCVAAMWRQGDSRHSARVTSS
jgi:hypothetical protein